MSKAISKRLFMLVKSKGEVIIDIVTAYLDGQYLIEEIYSGKIDREVRDYTFNPDEYFLCNGYKEIKFFTKKRLSKIVYGSCDKR